MRYGESCFKRDPGWKGILSLAGNFHRLEDLQFNFKYLYYKEPACSGKKLAPCGSVLRRIHSISVEEVRHLLFKKKTLGSCQGCKPGFLGYQNTSSEINCRSANQEISSHL